MADFFVGRPAPDFQLKDLDGADVHLSSFKGNIVLVDFWATWCGPCRAEIPALQRISKQFAKKNVVVIGVNSEESEDVVRRFAAKNKMTYRIALTTDNPAVIHAYGARALPTVAVIDKNGIVAAYRIGESPETERILHDDIHHVSASNYTPPHPKPIPAIQMPAGVPGSTVASVAGPDPNWKPETAEGFAARGFARLSIHQNAAARTDAEDALRLHPDWDQGLFLRGRAAYEEKDYSAAVEDFSRVIEQRPDWPQGYHYRGLSYSYQQQFQRAVPDYEKSLELDPYLTSAYNDLGWACRELNQLDKAKANLDKAIELEPDYVRARENRAILFAKQNKKADELAELDFIIKLAPNDEWAKGARAAAQAELESPSMPEPDSNWQPKTAEEFLARGYARFRIHKYPQAEADAEEALKLLPDGVTARFLHGRAAYDAQDYSRAIDDFEKVIGQKPDWPDAYRYRGLAYWHSGQHERSIPDFQKAIALNPNFGSAYNDLGRAYSELGQTEQAKSNLDKAIELEPNLIAARQNRAKLFAMQGDLQAEQKELGVILGLSPNNRWAKDTQEAVLQRMQ